MPFIKEGTILIKNLYECKGYSALQFLTEFSDKGWTKNSINSEVKEVRNSRHVNRQCEVQFSSLSVMQLRTNIS